MVVLALETVTRAGSRRAVGRRRVRRAMSGDAARTHGERLPRELLDWLARRSRCRSHDVDLLAVVAGPGSFTGLRVGMAAIQGLALARRPRRGAGADARRAGAAGGSAPGARPSARSSCACLDGQRGEVFFAALDVTRGAAARTRDAARSSPSVGAARRRCARRSRSAAPDRAPIVIVGRRRARGTRRSSARGLPASRSSTRRCRSPARRRAWRRAHPEQAVAPHALRPLYIRRPDAVLARERARRGAPVTIRSTGFAIVAGVRAGRPRGGRGAAAPDVHEPVGRRGASSGSSRTPTSRGST